MRTTVRLPQQLMRKAKKKAAETGRTLTALIEEGLNVVLADPTRRRRDARIQLPVSKASGGTLAAVDLNRSSDLEDQMSRP